ncbi:MAG: homoserine dehydrogenase, partial [Clostridia bacterium]|nr:homoserine dehydrogenase [Clostridia bacterium]
DVFNAVLVRGNAVGDVAMYGRGAGKLATASAVVADVIDAAVHIDNRKDFGWGDAEDGYVIDHNEVETALYVRAKGNRTLALRQAEELFSDISVLTRNGADEDEFAFVTPRDKEGVLREKLAKLENVEVISVIRVENY